MNLLDKAKNFLKYLSNFPTRIKNGYLQYYKNGWKWVHRTIAQIKIGRKIQPGDEVHHINREKLDNNPENLQILSKEDHRAIHQEELKRRIKKRLKKYSENRRQRMDSQMLKRRLEKAERLVRNTVFKNNPWAWYGYKRKKRGYRSTGCFRCGGSGYLPQYSHYYNGVCFRCSGSGSKY